MPDTCDLDLYEDVVYPVPETFYDKYEGRIAASEQEMNIIKDMDLVYDLKMADKVKWDSYDYRPWRKWP